MEKKRPSRARLLWLIPFILGTVYILQKSNSNSTYQYTQGLVFGTIYHVTYQHPEDLKIEIEQELKRFDASLSPFNKHSIISKVNRNEAVEVDTLFRNVFLRAMEVSGQTDRAFDITIAPLVNAWGFGFEKEKWPTEHVIDSLRQLTDYTMIALEGNRVLKKDPRVMITCSAIAKGYAVDVLAHLLERKGVENYMVDIGGEIVVKGLNAKKEKWRIGINKPTDDSLSVSQELQLILQLTDLGVATSGNYRNYYYRDGKKYAHTIDPRTGYPVQHDILSATVVAKDCMTADAFATAFMVMGRAEAEAFADAHPEIGACFIYTDEKGEYQIYLTENMKTYVVGGATSD